ncbi:hypothetical protein MED121_06195 [Marinomonas sp. MED121]|uniref:hypothetical protein n=1 Tax=Marinomonas sp. MED121 TaxID=314277 RepID=UPI00006903F7|nr:hypothetical protein [Marinomonas sp. MED121]EAQ66250.1 hypothetical protein MED121_06195 [Marinomonas sp. MED121]
MSKLAQWVMTRRMNAIIGVAAFSAIPLLVFLAGAIQALVVLRKGVAEGISVFAWGGLTALLLWVFQGDATTILILVQAALFSYVLRTTVSWGALFIAAVVIAVVNVFTLPLLMSGVLDILLEMMKELFSQMEVTGMDDERLYKELVVSMSVAQMCISIAAVFLARSWQSKLYNPGGLAKEFLQLKLTLPVTLTFAVMVFLGESLGESFQFLAHIVIPIFVLVGLALVHGVFAKKNIGKVGLIAFYLVGLFILTPYIVNILIVLVIVDSFVDIRGRISGAAPTSD